MEEDEGYKVLSRSISSVAKRAAEQSTRDRLHAELLHLRRRIEELEDQQRVYRHKFHTTNDSFFSMESDLLGEKITKLEDEKRLKEQELRSHEGLGEEDSE
jgi:hypothetical protein